MRYTLPTALATQIDPNPAAIATGLRTGILHSSSVVRALNHARVRTRGDLVVVATVREELGLRGMDWWLAHNPRPDMVVAVDGGLGPVSYGALPASSGQ